MNIRELCIDITKAKLQWTDSDVGGSRAPKFQCGSSTPNFVRNSKVTWEPKYAGSDELFFIQTTQNSNSFTRRYFQMKPVLLNPCRTRDTQALSRVSGPKPRYCGPVCVKWLVIGLQTNLSFQTLEHPRKQILHHWNIYKEISTTWFSLQACKPWL
jgi:hypothetical protein